MIVFNYHMHSPRKGLIPLVGSILCLLGLLSTFCNFSPSFQVDPINSVTKSAGYYADSVSLAQIISQTGRPNFVTSLKNKRDVSSSHGEFAAAGKFQDIVDRHFSDLLVRLNSVLIGDFHQINLLLDTPPPSTII